MEGKMFECENVFVRSYGVCDGRLAGLVDGLKELKSVMVLEENRSRVRVYEITPCVYLVVYGDTREGFSMDEFKYVVVWVDGRAVGMVVCKAQDCIYLLKREELDEFVKSYTQEGFKLSKA
jgi:hypothetical protein